MHDILQLGTVLLVLICIAGVITTVQIISLIFQYISIYKMSNKIGIKFSWLSFIPFSHPLTLGEVAEKLVPSNAKRTPKFNAIFTVLYILFAIILITPLIIFVFTKSANLSPILFSALLGCFAFIAFIYFIIRYIALYRIFNIFNLKKARLYLILSLLTGCDGFFLFACCDKEPQFTFKRNFFDSHVVKRDNMRWWQAWLIRTASIIAALIVSAIVITLLTDRNPIEFYLSMIDGVVGFNPEVRELRLWSFFQDIAILLCFALAVTPAFKMKFWNIGAEGQALVGGLATISVMMFCGDALPTPVLILVMVTASVVAGIIWAILPSIAKALWNTNETLFTLMMNYVATQLVAFFIKTFVKSGSGVLAPMPEYGLPSIFNQPYLLNIIIVAVLTILVFIYLKYTKQGYEISVVGESENTARYIGINVKKVVVRTMVISGALCGIAGLLLVGGTNHTISTTTTGGRGFTAIMVSWLAKFNPIFMILTSFLVVFLEKGAQQVSTDFRIPTAISDIVTGIILFFIIGCEFFLHYKIIFNTKRKENA